MVSDINPASPGIVNLILTVVEAVLYMLRSILGLPGLLLKHSLRTTLGFGGGNEDNRVAVNKGKGTKGSKGLAKKRPGAV